MDIKPQQLRSEAHVEVGSLIQRDAGILIERWSRRAVEEQPDAARVHHDVLLDHLPAFLQQMGRSLAEADVDNNGWHCPPAGWHGEQRWESGWSLAEVVRDYQILRLVILGYLEETLGRPPRGREVMAVGLVLDEAIAASVTRYGLHQKESARREAEALKRAERRKDEFLAVLSHELRNHLAPVSNATSVLGLGGGSPDTQGAREIIGRQVQQLTRIVDDLLDVTRLKQGKVSLQRRPVNLSAALEGAVEASRPRIDARRHKLTVSLPPEPLLVDGDTARLTQIFVNLLINAAKYTPAGGHIHLTAGREGGEVVVRVRDDGAGIPAEYLDQIFNLFVQAGGDEDGDRGGLGIGLSLVKSLVGLHGGNVQAFSEGPGKGSEFVVRLPAVAAEQASPGAGAEERAPETAPPSRRVLVVEDNRDSADSLALLLRMMGHTVRTAYDGPEALEVAREFRPEVVLLDIGLPNLGGLEVARRLREDPDLKGSVLAALSGYGGEDDLRRSRQAGFDAHLVKPCELEQLQALLRGARALP